MKNDRLRPAPPKYQWTPARSVFYSDPSKPIPFEVEGNLSTLQAIITTFLGLQAGKILKKFESNVGRVGRLLLWGIYCFIVFGISQIPGIKVPVNKQLYSFSYCYLTAGISFFLLAILYLMTERSRRNYKKIGFFGSCHEIELRTPLTLLQVCGKNSLALYVLHVVFRKNFLFTYYGDSHFWQLGFNCFGTAVWVLTAYIMDRRGVYLRV